MRQIFVDASGWIALYNRCDGNHTSAAQAFASLRNTAVRLITSDYVIDEALTHIRAWSGHFTAVQFGRTIKNHPLVDWVNVDSAIWDAGWDIFVRYVDKAFSFTDCTSFAIMGERALWEAFTFNAHFRQMGFQMWPEDS
jgi:hypothetical protein